MTSLNELQVQAELLKKLKFYLYQHGWQLIPHPNPNIEVFEGAKDDLGQPIQLVLPQSTELWDSSILLATALKLVAAIEEKETEEILVSIQSDQVNSGLIASNMPAPARRT